LQINRLYQFRLLFPRDHQQHFREVIEFADGGALGIDWLYADDCKDDAPIVLFLPGITGSTRDCAYILYPAIVSSSRNVYSGKVEGTLIIHVGLEEFQLRNKILKNLSDFA
ncbi:hypothetical protein COOONC_22498, partial [Cooperia oncophora]